MPDIKDEPKGILDEIPPDPGGIRSKSKNQSAPPPRRKPKGVLGEIPPDPGGIRSKSNTTQQASPRKRSPQSHQVKSRDVEKPYHIVNTENPPIALMIELCMRHT